MVINKLSVHFYAFIVFTIYIFLGTFYSVDSFKFITLIIFSILLVINLSLVFRKVFGKINNIKFMPIFLLFLISFFMMLLSALYNESLELFLGVLNFLFCFLFFCLNKLKRKVYEIFDLPIKLLFVVSTIFNFYYGFDIPFKGMFLNPNSLGGLYSTISLISMGVFYDKFIDIKKTDWVLILIIFLSCIFSLISNSRISFVISFVSLLLLIFLRFSDIFRFRNGGFYINIYNIFKILTVLSGLVFFIILNFNYILDIFIYKIMYKVENDNFSAGRSDIWKVIIENGLPWGYGRDSYHLESIGLAAHNTFMSIFDQFGYLSGLIFLISCLITLFYYSLPRIFKKYGILPLCVILGFILMSISESMINKTIMFGMLMVLNLSSYLKLEKK